MSAELATSRDRLAAGIGSALVMALLGYVLVSGLRVRFHLPSSDELQIVEVTAEPPPPPPRERPQPRRRASPRPEGAASPPNLRSRATDIVAPPPPIPLDLPSPVIAAPQPGLGNAVSTGAADVRGPGTGAGGIGTGTGGGGFGEGDGGGGGTPPRRIRGRIKDSDYPRSAGETGVGGTVSVRYRVGVDGRASDCFVTRSSGNAELDATTCGLIERRFRFDPSRDGRGRPVPSIIVENHSWMIEQDPEPPPQAH